MKKTIKSYSLWGTRVYSVITNEAYFLYTAKNGCEELHALPVGDDKADYVVSQPSFDNACHNIGMLFIKDSEKLLAEYDGRKQRLFLFSKKISDLAGKIDDKKLLELFMKYWDAVWDFQPYMMLPHFIERELEPWARNNFPSDFELISSNETAFEHIKMQEMLLTHTPAQIAKEYGWLAIYGMTEEPYDEKYFADEKKLIDKNKLAEAFKDFEDTKIKFSEFVRKLDKDDAVKCNILHKFVFMRTDRIDAWKKSLFLIYPFVQYIAGKIDNKLRIRDASMMSKNEIIDVLKGKSALPSEELFIRGERKTVVESTTKKRTSFTSDKKFIDTLIESYKKKIVADSVSGICACRGYAKGKVKLYLKRSDISESDSGYVLVCRHTTPQDLAYMKKAIAIIADEGGVTSHAAIVSRELNIPCIVGAKIATAVFSDGEIIEVDATKGIIRRL